MTTKPDSQLVDPMTDRALAALDPADRDLSAAARARSQDTLAAILATDPHAAAPDVVVPMPRRATRRRALWLVPATAAATLAGVVAIPGLLHHENTAYASWTAKPTAVADKDLQGAEKACREAVAKWDNPVLPADVRPVIDTSSIKLLLAERRGDYIFVALAGKAGLQANCLSDAGDPAKSSIGGAAGTATSAEQPRPTGGTVRSNGLSLSSGPEGSVVMVQGDVGPLVKSITLHSNGQNIDATVTDGHFAAWWPDKSVDVADPANPVLPSTTLSVTLTDGSTRDEPLQSEAPVRKAPGPREVGRIIQGGSAGSDGMTESIRGEVGSEVVGVVVQVAGHTVKATVADGTFTASWPVNLDDMASPHPVAEPTFTLTLRDGTVLRKVSAVR